MSKYKLYPWQQALWQRIAAMHERWPHALLITGQSGVGKLRLAQAIAAWKLCEQPTEQGACQVCHACQLIAGDSHPDWLTVTPEQNVIKIEQIRQLAVRLQATPQQGQHQVVILHPVSAMNRAASNALLKTLEEPAGAVTLLLIDPQAKRLPATIASRCQLFECPQPADDQVIPWLQQQLDIDATAAEALLKTAAGSPLSALNNAEFSNIRSQLLHLLGSGDSLALAEQLDQPYPALVDAIQTMFADLLHVQLLGDVSVFSSEELPLIQSILTRLQPLQVMQRYDQLCRSKLDYATNPAAHNNEMARFRALSTLGGLR